MYRHPFVFVATICAAVVFGTIAVASDARLDRNGFAALIDQHRYRDGHVFIDRHDQRRVGAQDSLVVSASDSRGHQVTIKQWDWHGDWQRVDLVDASRRETLELVVDPRGWEMGGVLRDGYREEFLPHQVDQWLSRYHLRLREIPAELQDVALLLTRQRWHDRQVPWPFRIAAGKILGLDRWAQVAPEMTGRVSPRYHHSLVSSAMYRLLAPRSFCTNRQMIDCYAGEDGAYDLILHVDDGERTMVFRRDQYNVAAPADTSVVFTRGASQFSIWQQDGRSPEFLASEHFLGRTLTLRAIDQALSDFVPRVRFDRRVRVVLGALAGGVVGLHTKLHDQNGSVEELVKVPLPRATSAVCRALLGQQPFRKRRIWHRVTDRFKTWRRPRPPSRR